MPKEFDPITHTRPVTAAEREQFDLARKLIAEHSFPRSFDPNNPHQRLYFRSFDGTGNDREASTSDIDTNPAQLESLIDNIDHEHVSTKYEKGVGTGELLEPYLAGASGQGAEAIAQHAYDELVKQVNQWRKEDPNAEIIVSAAGFSRGSATVRHFANLIEENGIPDKSTRKETTVFNDETFELETSVSYIKNLIEPGNVRIGSLLLYDTVNTGQHSVLNQSIPASVESVLHIVSADEHRINFSVESILDLNNLNDPRLLEITLPGVHTDIGGGYDHGIGALTLALGHTFLKSTITAIGDIPNQFNESQDESQLIVHDSDWWITNVLHAVGVNDFGEVRDVTYHENPPVSNETLLKLYPDYKPYSEFNSVIVPTDPNLQPPEEASSEFLNAPITPSIPVLSPALTTQVPVSLSGPNEEIVRILEGIESNLFTYKLIKGLEEIGNTAETFGLISNAPNLTESIAEFFSTAPATSTVNKAASSLTSGAGQAPPVSEFNTSDALSQIGIVISIAQGDPIGAAIGMIGLANPVVGTVLTVLNTLGVFDSLFGGGSPPIPYSPPEAVASFSVNEAGEISISHSARNANSSDILTDTLLCLK